MNAAGTPSRSQPGHVRANGRHAMPHAVHLGVHRRDARVHRVHVHGEHVTPASQGKQVTADSGAQVGNERERLESSRA